MSFYTLDNLKPEQQDELKKYAESLLTSIEGVSNPDERALKIAEFKSNTKEVALAYCHNVNPELIKGYDSSKMRQLRLALQDGLDIEQIKNLNAEEIFNMRLSEIANSKEEITTEEAVVETITPIEETIQNESVISEIVPPVIEEIEKVQLQEEAVPEPETDIADEILSTEKVESTIEEGVKEEVTLEEEIAAADAETLNEKDNNDSFDLGNIFDIEW